MYCPNCAVNYEKGQVSCLNCGSLLKSGIKCHSCNAYNSDSAFLCNLCGIPLKKNLKKVAKTRMQSMENVTKICPSCSEEYDRTSIFCKKCGNPLKLKSKYKTSNKSFISKFIEIFARKTA